MYLQSVEIRGVEALAMELNILAENPHGDDIGTIERERYWLVCPYPTRSGTSLGSLSPGQPLDRVLFFLRIDAKTFPDILYLLFI
ncbi:MAG: hypothetical protein WBB29_20860 [Geitlerinemataceae cyanobacterium]